MKQRPSELRSIATANKLRRVKTDDSKAAACALGWQLCRVRDNCAANALPMPELHRLLAPLALRAGRVSGVLVFQMASLGLVINN